MNEKCKKKKNTCYAILLVLIISMSCVIQADFTVANETKLAGSPDGIPPEAINWHFEEWLSFFCDYYNLTEEAYSNLDEHNKELLQNYAITMVDYYDGLYTWEETEQILCSFHNSSYPYSYRYWYYGEYFDPLSTVDLLSNTEKLFKIKFAAKKWALNERITQVHVYVRQHRYPVHVTSEGDYSESGRFTNGVSETKDGSLIPRIPPSHTGWKRLQVRSVWVKFEGFGPGQDENTGWLDYFHDTSPDRDEMVLEAKTDYLGYRSNDMEIFIQIVYAFDIFWVWNYRITNNYWTKTKDYTIITPPWYWEPYWHTIKSVDDDNTPPSLSDSKNTLTQWPYQYEFKMQDKNGYTYQATAQKLIGNTWYNTPTYYSKVVNDDNIHTERLNYPKTAGVYRFRISCIDNDNDIPNDRSAWATYYSPICTVHEPIVQEPTPQGMNGWVYKLYDNVDYNGDGITSANDVIGGDFITLQLVSATEMYNAEGDDDYDYNSNDKFDMIMGNVYFAIIRGGSTNARKLTDEGGLLELERGTWDFAVENNISFYTIPQSLSPLDKNYGYIDVDVGENSDFHSDVEGYYDSAAHSDAIYLVVPRWTTGNLNNEKRFESQDFNLTLKIMDTEFHIRVDILRYKPTKDVTIKDTEAPKGTPRNNLASPNTKGFFYGGNDVFSIPDLYINDASVSYPEEIPEDPWSLIAVMEDLKVSCPGFPDAWVEYDVGFGVGPINTKPDHYGYPLRNIFSTSTSLDFYMFFQHDWIRNARGSYDPDWIGDWEAWGWLGYSSSFLRRGYFSIALDSLKYGDYNKYHELGKNVEPYDYATFIESDLAGGTASPSGTYIKFKTPFAEMGISSGGGMSFGINLFGFGITLGDNPKVISSDYKDRAVKYKYSHYAKYSKKPEYEWFNWGQLPYSDQTDFTGDYLRMDINKVLDLEGNCPSVVNLHLELDIITQFREEVIIFPAYHESGITTCGFDLQFIVASHDIGLRRDDRYFNSYAYRFSNLINEVDFRTESLPEIIFDANTELKLGESTEETAQMINNDNDEKVVDIVVANLNKDWYQIVDESGQPNSRFVIPPHSSRTAKIKIEIPELYSITPGDYPYQIHFVNGKNSLISSVFNREITILETAILDTYYNEKELNLNINAGEQGNLHVDVKNLGNKFNTMVSAEVIGIDSSWYELNEVISLDPNSLGTLNFKFDIPWDANIGEIPLQIKIFSFHDPSVYILVPFVLNIMEFRGVTLSASKELVSISQGETDSLVVTISNLQQTSDTFSLYIENLDPTWYTITDVESGLPVDEIYLNPMEKKHILLNLHPNPTFSSGNSLFIFDFQFVVESNVNQFYSNELEITLICTKGEAVYLDIVTNVEPATIEIGYSITYLIKLKNPTSLPYPLTYQIEISGLESQEYALEKTSTTLDSFGADIIDLKITPLISDSIYNFQVSICDESGNVLQQVLKSFEVISDDDQDYPVIYFEYFGDGTDNPNIDDYWEITAFDKSGIGFIEYSFDGVSFIRIYDDNITVDIDDASLLPQNLIVRARDNDFSKGLDDPLTSTATAHVTLIDDDELEPEILITYDGIGTDELPGKWIVDATDDSGINEIQVYIDGEFAGNWLGDYVVPNSLGTHSIQVKVWDNDIDRGLVDREFSEDEHEILIQDDDIIPPELISITYPSEVGIIEPEFTVELELYDFSGISEITCYVKLLDGSGSTFFVFSDINFPDAETIIKSYVVPMETASYSLYEKEFELTFIVTDNDKDRLGDELSNDPISITIISDDDLAPPIFTIEAVDCISDENPGNWRIIAEDESGLFEIGLNIDDIELIFTQADFGTGTLVEILIPINNELGEHTCEGYAIDADIDRGSIDQMETIQPLVSCFIIDDDTDPPVLSELLITDTILDITISFILLDTSGCGEVVITIDGISHVFNEVEGEVLSFVIVNSWIMDYGVHDVEIIVWDADLDRVDDSMSSMISGMFTVSLEEMLHYILWEIDQLIESIISSPDECWRNKNNKNAMINKLYELKEELIEDDDELEFDDLEEVYEDLLHDIKPKLTGLKTDENEEPWGNGVFKKPWVICPELQETFQVSCNVILGDLKTLIAEVTQFDDENDNDMDCDAFDDTLQYELNVGYLFYHSGTLIFLTSILGGLIGLINIVSTIFSSKRKKKQLYAYQAY